MPKEFGNWHTTYTRFNRWSKNGTIDRIFEELQRKNIIEIRTEIVCIDSTSIKVHPDATEARKENGHFLLMDRAYEDEETRTLALWQGFIPVVPPKKKRKNPWKYDKELYKQRNEIERFFFRIKRFRKVFTRYDKLDVTYIAVVTMAMIDGSEAEAMDKVFRFLTQHDGIS